MGHGHHAWMASVPEVSGSQMSCANESLRHWGSLRIENPSEDTGSNNRKGTGKSAVSTGGRMLDGGAVKVTAGFSFGARLEKPR